MGRPKMPGSLGSREGRGTSVGGTPPRFSHRTDVSLTLWVSDLQREWGCGRPQTLQAQALPVARGEHILTELAPLLRLRVSPYALCRARPL